MLDLLEGRLSVEEERKLNDFLKDHPDLVVDLPDLELFSLEKTPESYAGKAELKKALPTKESILSESNFDMFSIARMEGDLNPVQLKAHEELLAGHADLQEEWHSWQETKLRPEEIAYPNKDALKRKGSGRSRWLWVSGIAAAASVALLVFLLQMDSPIPGMADLGPQESTPVQQDAEVVIRELPLASEEGNEIQREGTAIPEQSGEEYVEESGADIIMSSQIAQVEPEEEVLQAAPVEVKARPIRIADNLSSTSSLVEAGNSDRIVALEIGPLPPKTARLPLNDMGEIDRRIVFEEFSRENNISLLSVANAGIKGINKLTGSDISLMASRDEEGEVSGYRLKSRRFSFSRPLDREE